MVGFLADEAVSVLVGLSAVKRARTPGGGARRADQQKQSQAKHKLHAWSFHAYAAS
jgi:hypothetical protein